MECRRLNQIQQVFTSIENDKASVTRQTAQKGSGHPLLITILWRDPYHLSCSLLSNAPSVARSNSSILGTPRHHSTFLWSWSSQSPALKAVRTLGVASVYQWQAASFVLEMFTGYVSPKHSIELAAIHNVENLIESLRIPAILIAQGNPAFGQMHYPFRVFELHRG
jgi:hypothetical protein